MYDGLKTRENIKKRFKSIKLMFNFTGNVWFSGDSNTTSKKRRLFSHIVSRSHDEQTDILSKDFHEKKVDFVVCCSLFQLKLGKSETIIAQLLGTVEASSAETTRAR